MKSLIRNIWTLSLVVLSFLLYSCGGNQNESAKNGEDSKKVAEEHNDAKFEKAAESDAQFLVDAATINLEEIQLGKLAEDKGNSKEVKDLGKKLSDAHASAQNGLTSLAERKGITVPTSAPDESLKNYDVLKTESSTNFDKKFADLMVDGHKDAISIFVKASTDCEDADIRDWASKMLPELRAHLDQAMNCKQALRAETNYKDK